MFYIKTSPKSYNKSCPLEPRGEVLLVNIQSETEEWEDTQPCLRIPGPPHLLLSHPCPWSWAQEWLGPPLNGPANRGAAGAAGPVSMLASASVSPGSFLASCWYICSSPSQDSNGVLQALVFWDSRHPESTLWIRKQCSCLSSLGLWRYDLNGLDRYDQEGNYSNNPIRGSSDSLAEAL